MMATLAEIGGYLLPWEFSATVVIACVGAPVLYARGARALGAAAPGGARRVAFYSGVALLYLFLHTHIDYLSQHMFWVHRLQHLVLHHLAPMLIALGLPAAPVVAALPAAWRAPAVWRWPLAGYRLVQHPLPATVLFAGLVWFWLMPSIHFDAMLSEWRYKAMNWSMAVDGLLFWWLIVDPRAVHAGRTLGFGVRLAMLGAVLFSQIVIGAWITLRPEVIYDAYDICGRAWPISALTDQQIGGLLTWIPPSMMTVVGALIVLRLWMHADHGQPRHVRARRAQALR